MGERKEGGGEEKYACPKSLLFWETPFVDTNGVSDFVFLHDGLAFSGVSRVCLLFLTGVEVITRGFLHILVQLA